jgi:anti-sigma regulatory factor (Ser/Thr protein kinase)
MTDIRSPALRLRLQAVPDSARLLRERLLLWLDELGAQEGEAFDISVAVTEAFANALEHPRGRRFDLVDVRGRNVGEDVFVVVRDYGSWREHRRRRGGYGFPLMRALMDSVRVHTKPRSTSIILRRELRRTRARGPAPRRAGTARPRAIPGGARRRATVA